jgi:threonine dehydratase
MPLPRSQRETLHNVTAHHTSAGLAQMSLSVGLKEILEASQFIHPWVRRTPVVVSQKLNTLCGGNILFKLENLQNIGVFKIRGASNFVRQIAPEVRKRGLVAYSSGNHAQAVAYIAHCYDIPATIVMPEDAPRTKIEGTQYWGAKTVFYDRMRESREVIAGYLSEEMGATLIPPYDHPWVISGQGTVGLELFQQADEMKEVLDCVLVPCSGGGLTAGCAVALHGLSPNTQVYGVEPENYQDTALSLKAGKITSVPSDSESICDSLMMTQPGALTFPLNQSLLAGVITATDASVRQAMRLAFDELKVVLEPGGAIGLASILEGRINVSNKTIGVVLSGGNVDKALFQSILLE